MSECCIANLLRCVPDPLAIQRAPVHVHRVVVRVDAVRGDPHSGDQVGEVIKQHAVKPRLAHAQWYAPG